MKTSPFVTLSPRRSLLAIGALMVAILPALESGVWASTPEAHPALLEDSQHEEDMAYLLKEIGERAERVLKAKGINWKKVSRTFQARAKDVSSDQELVDLAAQLIAELHDGHARFTKVDVEMDGFGEGPRAPCGLNLYEHKGKWHVLRAVGDAKKAGVEAGWEVVKIDGVKAADWMEEAAARLTSKRGFSTERASHWIVGTWGMNGPEGESCSFEFKDVKRKKKKKTLSWRDKAGGDRLYGPVVYPEGLKPIGKDVAYRKLESGMGYILAAKVPGDLHEAFDEAIQGMGDIDGLILDFRSNMGGGYDRDAVLGRFVPEGESFGGEKSAGPNPYTGQIVVLIDPATISAAETIVGELKEEGRAYLIGPGGTHGASGSKHEVEVPSGKFAIRFVIASNKQRFNGGKGVEGLGIEPDEIVEYDPKLISAGVDPCISRAEVLLKSALPKKAVTYVPPKG
ncbi:MAG: C-terminal processing protease CtpA/Prc [Planctomycetota bacterium]|jgi:C-terminal processing protease CtpA/Prc